MPVTTKEESILCCLSQRKEKTFHYYWFNRLQESFQIVIHFFKLPLEFIFYWMCNGFRKFNPFLTNFSLLSIICSWRGCRICLNTYFLIYVHVYFWTDSLIFTILYFHKLELWCFGSGSISILSSLKMKILQLWSSFASFCRFLMVYIYWNSANFQFKYVVKFHNNTILFFE